MPERFWSKVDVRGPNDCWEWEAGKTGGGYGCYWFGGRTVMAYRYAYVLTIGPIPAGLQIDHLCRNRGCVNPAHLEPVTPQTNVLRGGTLPALHAGKCRCPAGHQYDSTNTYYRRDRTGRNCRACDSDKQRRRRAAAKEATCHPIPVA